MASGFIKYANIRNPFYIFDEVIGGGLHQMNIVLAPVNIIQVICSFCSKPFTNFIYISFSKSKFSLCF